jgi:hypothetical protein
VLYSGATISVRHQFGSPSGFPLEALTNTVVCFMELMKVQLGTVLDYMGVGGVTNTRYGEMVSLHNPYPGAVYQTVSVYKLGFVQVVDSIPCNMAIDYQMKQNLVEKLIHSNKSNVHPGSWSFFCDQNCQKLTMSDQEEEIQVGHFTYCNTRNDKRSFYKTQFVSLEGVRKFTHWSNCGQTMITAMSRIIKSRPNELQLQYNQGSLLEHMIAKGYFKRVGVKHSAMWSDWEMDEGVSIDSKLAVTSAYDKLLLRCRRHTLSTVNDMIKASDSVCTVAADGVSKLATLAESVYDLVRGAFDLSNAHEAREITANVRHAKRALRIKYFQSRQMHTSYDNFIKRTVAHVKNETAKGSFVDGLATKPGRLFVSYGDGCMYAAQVPEYIKACINGLYTDQVNGWTITIWVLAKEPGNKLQDVFDLCQLYRKSPKWLLVVLYSDDSIYVGNDGESDFMYNVDIKSCDSGQAELVFSMVEELMGQVSYRYARGLVKQCEAPLKIPNPSDKNESLTIHFKRPFEGSGTVLTTINNHIASYLIASMFSVTSDNMCIEERIQMSAGTVGHLVTVEKCTSFEQLQFLKYSPILTTDGEYIPVRNFGAIIRNFGKVDGDLCAHHLGVDSTTFIHMPLAERFNRFFSAVVMSYKHEPSSPILLALRQKFNFRCDVEVEFEGFVQNTSNNADKNLDTSSLLRRYPGVDFDAISQIISSLEVGDVVVDHGFTTIYEVDYGL